MKTAIHPAAIEMLIMTKMEKDMNKQVGVWFDFGGVVCGFFCLFFTKQRGNAFFRKQFCFDNFSSP